MKMKNGRSVINVTEHIILKNGWEYYIHDDYKNGSIVSALVMGYETEFGDVCLEELKPYIISRTKRLNEVLPAEGWNWMEENA